MDQEEILKKMAIIFDEPDNNLMNQLNEVNKQRYIQQTTKIEMLKQQQIENDKEIQKQKQQFQIFEKQIIAEQKKQQQLDSVLKQYEQDGKVLSEDGKKYVSNITILSEKLEATKKSFNQQQEKFDLVEKENQNLLKEYDNWNKNLKNIQQESSKKDQRQIKLTEELAALKVSKSQPEQPDDLQKAFDRLLQDNKRLQKQRAEVVAVFKKQAKIIEVLKKQKLHLETSTTLDLTEQDFAKIVDFQLKRFSDVEHLIQLRKEHPKPKEYLYDYKLQEALKQRDVYSKEEFKKNFKIDFEDLPISRNTLKGLQQRKFFKMTEIQRCTLPHALADRDILGASRTGSGKTLAYLIPLIEKLYINKWTPLDGLGAIVLLPTRELAMQVFEVYNSIATEHVMSIGLLIGGKNYEYERDRIQGMNILICTPGRLLQHFEESPDFDAANLQMLVIDEADLMFELGFQSALNAIFKYIPQERQTLMFSATLSKNIHSLSLNLRNPELIYLHERDDSKSMETPNRLKQFYMVVPIEDKIDIVYSFIKTHPKQKILIFVSSCKQVRFMYESFSKLKLGITMLELHGRQKQDKRTAIFFTFTEKRSAVLFTTNIASRGLDFPKVDWVINMDCPDDVQTYIHRVGRTARYNAGGFSVLMLLPSEAQFAERLKQKGLDIQQKFPNTQKQFTIKQTLQSMVSENVSLKYLAQRAFISYIRSVDINGDKEIFDIRQIKTDLLAESLGLIQTPVLGLKDDSDEEQQKPKQTKLQKLKEKIELKKQMHAESHKPQDVKHLKTIQRESDINKFDSMKTKQYVGDDNLLGGLLVQKSTQSIQQTLERPALETSKRSLKKIKPEGIFNGRNKTYFDDEGNAYTEEEMRLKQIKEDQSKVQNLDFTARYASKVLQHDEDDRQNELERRKVKRQKKKVVSQLD